MKIIQGAILRKRACEMLGITPGTLRRWERKRRIVGYKISSRATVYKIKDVEKLLEQASTAALQTFEPPAVTPMPHPPNPARGKRKREKLPLAKAA
jgi:hypothetical protein